MATIRLVVSRMFEIDNDKSGDIPTLDVSAIKPKSSSLIELNSDMSHYTPYFRNQKSAYRRG